MADATDVKPDKLWYLQRIRIFQDLTAEEMEEVKECTYMQRYEANEQIFRQGQTAAALFLLKEGNVRLSRHTEEGKEIVLAVLSMGEVFGDLPLFGQEFECCEAKALSPVLLCRVSAEEFERLIKRRPAIAIKVIRVLGERLSDFQQTVESLHTKTAKQRLAEMLLKLAEQHSLRTRMGLAIKLRLTQQELANMIGATREMVAVHIGELREEQVILTPSHRVIIRDVHKLRRIASA